MNSFKIQRTVLFGDCDPAGAIYTPRAAHFVVEALLEFQAFRLNGPAARKIFELGILPPAKLLSIEFAAPLTYDDRLELEVACVDIGTTSFTCQVTATRQDGEVAFRGQLTQVCVSPETKRPVAIPAALRSALQSDA